MDVVSPIINFEHQKLFQSLNYPFSKSCVRYLIKKNKEYFHNGYPIVMLGNGILEMDLQDRPQFVSLSFKGLFETLIYQYLFVS